MFSQMLCRPVRWVASRELSNHWLLSRANFFSFLLCTAEKRTIDYGWPQISSYPSPTNIQPQAKYIYGLIYLYLYMAWFIYIYIWLDLYRWLLRSIFAMFPEQLLNGLVSWGSPGKYYMIDYFLGDALWVFSCPFWNTAMWSGARLPIDTFTTWPCSQWCQLFNWVCVWVWPWTSSISGGIMYDIQDQV